MSMELRGVNRPSACFSSFLPTDLSPALETVIIPNKWDCRSSPDRGRGGWLLRFVRSAIFKNPLSR